METQKLRDQIGIIKGMLTVAIGHFEPDMKLKDPTGTLKVIKEAHEHVWNIDMALTEKTELTDREKEVFEKIIVHGLPITEAADALFITDKTIKFHLTSIYRKLGTSRKSLLIVEYYKNELAKTQRDKTALQEQVEKLSAGSGGGCGELPNPSAPGREH